MPTPARFGIVTFRERVHVPVIWWVVALGVTATLAVAVFAYVEPVIGILFSVFSFGIVIAGLVSYTQRIRVGDGVLQVGRNRLEAGYIGEVTAFRGKDANRALGPGADHSSFLQTRPFIRDLVKVEVVDEADPHSSWLVNTRRPEELADAVRALKEA